MAQPETAPSTMPIVDAHHHFWDPTRNHHPWLCDEPMIPFRYADYAAIRRPYLPPDYFADAGRHRVVKTVYVETEWEWGSLCWSLPSLLVPARRVGFVGSLMNCTGSCGGILIPIVTGLLLQATGSFDAVISFFSACALVYVLATLFIGLRHTR